VDAFYYIYKSKLQINKEEKKEMNVVENEIIKELNWKEKIIIKIFAKTFEKVVNIVRISVINKLIN
jgi:hypothetical protein